MGWYREIVCSWSNLSQLWLRRWDTNDLCVPNINHILSRLTESICTCLRSFLFQSVDLFCFCPDCYQQCLAFLFRKYIVMPSIPCNVCCPLLLLCTPFWWMYCCSSDGLMPLSFCPCVHCYNPISWLFLSPLSIHCFLSSVLDVLNHSDWIFWTPSWEVCQLP